MTETLLEVRNLTKTFGGLVALRDVTFSIRRGGVIGIIGPNGSGKSTLINVITGIGRATMGEVEFCGRSIVGLRPSAIFRLGLNRTFQSTRVFAGMSVRRNLQIVAWTQRLPSSDVDHQLEQFGLASVAELNAENLSYGDRKMLELGMSLIGRPKLVLLDEPLAGVHESVVLRVSTLLREIKTTTFVVVEHNVPFVTATCEQIFVLNQGQLIANGTPAEIRSNPAVIAAYLGSGADSHRVLERA